MATNITKKEAIKHYLLPNRNTLHIYEDLSKKKKKKLIMPLKYQFTGNTGTCQNITLKFNH